jgi:diguanylate cyclase (GGDEF)-like protein/PAS domain S-box-containing protein
MKPADISLSTRITLLALGLVAAGGLLWTWNENQRLKTEHLMARESALDAALHVERERLQLQVETLKRDAVFLSHTPPIGGIMRSIRNGGIDPRENNTRQEWERRLQDIFGAYLDAHPEYFQARYIGLADDGRELVRVDRTTEGRFRVAPPRELQRRGDRDYFQAGLALSAGQVHLSRFDLDQEHGQAEVPHRPTLRAVTAVFDEQGRRFGMLVLNMDVTSLLAAVSKGLPSGIQTYITDQQGYYLAHPDKRRAFVFDTGGGEGDIRDDFPVLRSKFATDAGSCLPLRQSPDGRGGYLAAEKVVFDRDDPARFLLLAYHVPQQALQMDEIGIPWRSQLNALLLMLLASGVFMLVLRVILSPLKRIAVAAREIADDHRPPHLREKGSGEIRELVRSLNIMLEKLTAGDVLERENAFRKELIDSLPGVFYMVGMDGTFLMWNRNFEQVLGVGANGLDGKNALELFEGEDRRVIEARIREVFERGESEAEASLVTAWGTRIPYHFTGRRVMFDGSPVLVGLGLDVSARRSYLRQIEAQLKRNLALRDNSMEGVHVMDAQGKLIEVNAAFCNMLGYAREEALQLNVRDWDDQFSSDELAERFRQLNGKSAIFETKHKRNDGTLLDVEVCATGVEIDGELYMYAASRDITERKKVEEVMLRHHHVVETAMDGYWMTSADGFLLEANEAYARMSGYTVQELLTMHISQLEASERPEQVKAHIDKIIALGRDRFETRHRRKDGSVIDIEVSATFRDGHFYVFSRDISGRKQAEHALRDSENKFHALFDSMTEGVALYELVLDASGVPVDYVLLDVNPAYETITSLRRADVIGHRASEAYGTQQAPYLDRYAAVALTGQPDHFDTRFEPMRQVFAISVFSPARMQFATVFEDITERMKVEEVMLRHHQVVEAAMDGYWMTSADGVLEEANASYARITGYTVQELVGMHISQLEANERPEEVKAHIDRIIARGHDRFETRHRRKDGSLVDVEMAVTFDAESRRFMAFCRDISRRKRDADRLQHQQDLLNEAQRLGQLGSWEFVPDTGELIWSDETFRILELERDSVVPNYERFQQAIHPDDRDAVDAAYQRSLREGGAYDIEHRLLFADGRIKWVREHCRTTYDDTGRPLRSVGMVQDITARKRDEEQLRVAAAAFETHDAILITDAQSNILRVNHAFTQITGYRAWEVAGMNPRIMSSGRHDADFYKAMWRQLLEQGAWSGEIWDRRKNGEIYPKWMTITAVKDEAGSTINYVAIFSDITERKRNEEEIRGLAFYDALTRLPNRRLFMDRLQNALAASARNGDFGALLFIDLDRFKVLNDTLGHDYGDLLLVEVAERIKGCVREIDTVARLGGDEFVVVLEGIGADREEASHKAGLVAEKIRDSLAHPYQLKEHEHYSSPSIGVELFHDGEENTDDLIKHADVAMYQAKNAGRNTVRFYDPGLQHDLDTRAMLENDLRRAIENEELQLHYQVQVDNERKLVGVEALLRWQHPVRGMIPPAKFIPVAEESMLIVELGDWVLHHACAQLVLWADDPLRSGLTMAVNVSAHQFAMHDFVEHLAAILQRHGVQPARLKLELTEGVVLNDIGDVVEKMRKLKALGVQLSLDDFGTGYSSLSYLKKLPLDQLKIDKSFVRDITVDQSDAGMVQSIIDMAKNFKHDVIAEGVETEAQLSFLKHHACLAYQGYFFSKPLPLEELERLIADWGSKLDD